MQQVLGKGMDDDERGMDHSAHEDCVGCRNCGILRVVEFGDVAAAAAAVNTRLHIAEGRYGNDRRIWQFTAIVITARWRSRQAAE